MIESRQQPSGCDLDGAGVLVTRAPHQAEPLCALVTRLGGQPIRFPVVEIRGPAQPAAVEQLLLKRDEWDLMIFVSPNSVEWGLKCFPQGLPGQVTVAAVGGRTAELLAEAGYKVDVVPQGRSDSEALLAMAAFKAVAGKRIVICRGDGGRPLLGETLSSRGAEVAYLEAYRRTLPMSDAAPLVKSWPQRVSVVTVTSNDLLDNLFTLLGPAGQALLCSTPLIVISERMLAHAMELGCKNLLLAEGADLPSLQKAICGWHRGG